MTNTFFISEIRIIDAFVLVQIWIPETCIEILRGVTSHHILLEFVQLVLCSLDPATDEAGVHHRVQEEQKPHETCSEHGHSTLHLQLLHCNVSVQDEASTDSVV